MFGIIYQTQEQFLIKLTLWYSLESLKKYLQFQSNKSVQDPLVTVEHTNSRSIGRNLHVGDRCAR